MRPASPALGPFSHLDTFAHLHLKEGVAFQTRKGQDRAISAVIHNKIHDKLKKKKSKLPLKCQKCNKRLNERRDLTIAHVGCKLIRLIENLQGTFTERLNNALEVHDHLQYCFCCKKCNKDLENEKYMSPEARKLVYTGKGTLHMYFKSK
jgi:hypothetical protein